MSIIRCCRCRCSWHSIENQQVFVKSFQHAFDVFLELKLFFRKSVYCRISPLRVEVLSQSLQNGVSEQRLLEGPSWIVLVVGSLRSHRDQQLFQIPPAVPIAFREIDLEFINSCMA